MKDTLFKIALFVRDKKEMYRSHFYRHQELLKMRCDDFKACELIKSEKDSALAKILGKYGPLIRQDFESEVEQNKFIEWKHLPADPKFYSMLIEQDTLWKKFKGKTIQDFVDSNDCEAWLKSRKRLKRQATFELDTHYKSTKATALKKDIAVRRLIRNHPLITYTDLKRLDVKNAQSIWERFPQRELHRERALALMSPELDV